MFESFKNLIISFRESTIERVRNPLLSSYLFFLIAINWRVPVILLFGEGNITERMRLIDTYSYTLFYTLTIPLVLAILYVLLMPWITLLIQNHQEKPLIEQKKRKIEQELEMATDRKKIIEETVSSEMIRSRVKLDMKEREIELDKAQKDDEHKRKVELIMKEYELNIRKVEMERDEFAYKIQNLNNEIQNLKSENSTLIKETNSLSQTIIRLKKSK